MFVLLVRFCGKLNGLTITFVFRPQLNDQVVYSLYILLQLAGQFTLGKLVLGVERSKLTGKLEEIGEKRCS